MSRGYVSTGSISCRGELVNKSNNFSLVRVSQKIKSPSYTGYVAYFVIYLYIMLNHRIERL